jgi:para-nitrobenzyl esterase
MKLEALSAFLFVVSAVSIKVEIENGKIKGTRMKSEFVFYRIPYAKPPVGELRFQAPQPADDWQGVRDATTAGPMCFQRCKPGEGSKMSEDCLHLNVFTRNLTGSQPVVVWIHGGAFIKGSSLNLGEFSIQ